MTPNQLLAMINALLASMIDVAIEPSEDKRLAMVKHFMDETERAEVRPVSQRRVREVFWVR